MDHVSQQPFTPVRSCAECWRYFNEDIADSRMSKVGDTCQHNCGRVVFDVTDEGPPYGVVVATTRGRVVAVL